MLLQDPGWAGDPAGATERVRRVVAYHAARRASGLPGFAGLHFDIEPHSDEAGPAPRRPSAPRRSGASTRSSAGRARPCTRERRPPRRTLTAALPWWLGHLSVEVPNAAPAEWLVELDEVVLMVYGDPGGPAGGRIERRGRPAHRRRAALARPAAGPRPPHRSRDVRAQGPRRAARDHRGRSRPRSARGAGFRGVAIFANDQVWDAPLVPFVEGRVVDASGGAVAGARLRGAGHDVESNRCGGFGFKGLPVEGVELEVTARGYLPARVPLGRLVPGRVRELPPVRLERAP